MFHLLFMIEKAQPDVLTLSMILHDLSVSRNLFSKAEMRQFGTSETEGLSDKKLINMKLLLVYLVLIFIVRF